MTGADNGLLLASDTAGSQLLIYTRMDVIRLNQSMPVDASPWAVAWDPRANIAWVASTATNTVTGYTISTGEPVETARYSTVGNARSITVLDDSTLVVASHSGDGVQFLDKSS